MIRSYILFISCYLLLSCGGYAQKPITTFILVRHAEKENDGTSNPNLSIEGKNRASNLANLLKETHVDAILSTPYKRTFSTVQPLAEAKKLTIETYEAMKDDEMDRILNKYKGLTVVICGHSNTTPWTVNYFLGTAEYPPFEDSDYDNLIILDVVEKGQAKATWLNYGKTGNP